LSDLRLPKAVRHGLVLGLCIGLWGCVTPRQTEPADLSVLEQALVEPVEILRQHADAGQARAQFALAVLYAYGARGLAQDSEHAESLRRRALAARGYTPITTYVAGLHGKPGRVSIINVPRYDLDTVQAMRIEHCAGVLARGESGLAAVEACAGSAQFSHLKALWGEAKGADRRGLVVPPP
jgi:hypothetical protein